MKSKILVVDDDPVVRVLVTEFLGSRGYQVETLDSGNACLERLVGESPDVLVLDMLMPDLTGIEVLKNIRQNPATASLPIVMLSSDTEIESVVTTNDVSANSYVRKPFGLKEILGAVESITARTRQTELSRDPTE